jgi:acetyltransferase-like isoleucine patch superfamily enzyme
MRSICRYILNFAFLLFPPTSFYAFKRILARYSGFQLSDGVKLNGGVSFVGDGKVFVGANTWIGAYNRFYLTRLAEIKIGANCDVGPDVAFVPGSHEIGNCARRAGKGAAGNIVIEDGCWIGARVTILGGVTIGKGAIIGAGALVNKDVPANTIYAGVPARLVRKLNDDEEI